MAEQRLPPLRLRGWLRARKFWEHGQSLCRLVADQCGEIGGAHVLELGCGLGRTARFLPELLGAAGGYAGLDSNRDYIEWCRRSLALELLSSEFVHANVHSPRYNRAGTIATDSYSFPWPEGTFDLVLVPSLFTHLQDAALARYAREIHRVLMPGGMLFAAFYVLDPESRKRIADKATPLKLPLRTEVGRLASARRPERTVAYDQEWLADLMLSKVDFELRSFATGAWRNQASRHHHDLAVLVKTSGYPPLPPLELRAGIGDGSFWLTGRQIASHVERCLGDLSGLAVLDLGCGLGRVAYFLEPRLGPAGSYVGFDINRDYIDWCSRALQLPSRFRFEVSDVHSTLYNPSGTTPAERFAFPWPDRAYDLVLATSLFTHLEGEATRAYLREVHRVLKPGGRLYASFYLLDDATTAGLRAGQIWPRFEHERSYGRILDPAAPERAVAHRQDWLESAVAAIGFELERREPGSWRAAGAAHYQDVVVLKKTAPGAS